MIEKPTKGSPVDAILLAASIFFPLDFVLLTFIVKCPKTCFAKFWQYHSCIYSFSLQILYLLLCSFHGLVSLGVRCICIQLFAVKKRATQPQGLLLLCMYLSLLVSAMQWQIASLAPQVSFILFFDVGLICSVDAILESFVYESSDNFFSTLRLEIKSMKDLEYVMPMHLPAGI